MKAARETCDRTRLGNLALVAVGLVMLAICLLFVIPWGV